MGIKASEGFLDLVAITDTATGLLKTGLSPTCTVYKISDGTPTSLTVVELGTTGLYKVTNLTFGTATEYVTVWAVAGAYTIHYPFKLFKVGGGQEADIYTDTQALVIRLTAIRAGYLDNLSGGAIALNADMATLLSRLSAARAGYLDELGATNIPADVDTLLSRISAARAGYFDNLSAGAVALASVCTEARLAELAAANLPADVDTLLTRITAAVALASVCTETRLAELDAANLPTDVAALNTLLSNATYGLSALETLVDDLEGRLTATRAAYLDNLSVGPVALASVCTEARLGELAAANLPADVDTLIARLTAARAGYLDKLANHVVIDTFWSAQDDVIDLPAAATDTDLPNIVLPNIAGTIDHVYVGIKIAMKENTSASGTNAIAGAQAIRIKKSTGTWGVDDVACINLTDNQWLVAASTREGGDVQVGTIDVVGEVDAFNATYNLRFENADVDYDFLRLNDVQVFLKIIYH